MFSDQCRTRILFWYNRFMEREGGSRTIHLLVTCKESTRKSSSGACSAQGGGGISRFFRQTSGVHDTMVHDYP